jgi:hypothetical protein
MCRNLVSSLPVEQLADMLSSIVKAKKNVTFRKQNH